MVALLIFIVLLPPPIAITEFNVDPVDGRPGYVELQNTTEHAINLRNWRLQRRQTSSETNRFISTTDLMLEPGAFLVLVADVQAMRVAHGDGPYHAMTRYPTFNRTTADELRLFDASGARIDSLQYHPSIWIRGTSHERRSVRVNATYSENWEPGFSPGQPNLAAPPTTPLRIEAIGIKEPDQVAIRFSRRLDEFSIGCEACFQSTETGLMVDFMAQNSVVITATRSNYVLEISRLSDLFGNALPDTLIPIHADYARPERHDILLNELFLWGFQPFIELYNPTHQTFDISGLTLNGRALPRPEVLPGFHIPAPLGPQSYAEFTSWAALTKTSNGIGIRHPNGTLIDTLRYGSHWVFGPESVSLERVSSDGLTNDPANWKPHPSSHSRLTQNHHHQLVSDFPSPDIVDLFETRIRIRFPRFRMPERSLSVYVDDVLVPVLPVNLMQADTWYLDIPSGDELTIETGSLVIGPIPVSRPSAFGALLINEILYQPHQERYSGKPDQPQFIELFNPMPHAVSIEGIHITDEPDKNGSVTKMMPVSSSRRWIPAGGYLAMYADTALTWSNTRMTRSFPDTEERNTMRFQRSTLSLTQSGKTIRIVDANGTVIDSVRYSPTWHHPERVSPGGYSLEKIDPLLESHIKANWTTSASEFGATPAAPNSVIRTPTQPMSSARIVADPNPFSGLQSIHVSADQHDYLVRLRIYDRYGRLIRTLSENDPLGNGRYWWWNGLRDDGQKPPIGVYVLVADLVGSSRAKNQQWRHILVLAR